MRPPAAVASPQDRFARPPRGTPRRECRDGWCDERVTHPTAPVNPPARRLPRTSRPDHTTDGADRTPRDHEDARALPRRDSSTSRTLGGLSDVLHRPSTTCLGTTPSRVYRPPPGSPVNAEPPGGGMGNVSAGVANTIAIRTKHNQSTSPAPPAACPHRARLPLGYPDRTRLSRPPRRGARLDTRRSRPRKLVVDGEAEIETPGSKICMFRPSIPSPRRARIRSRVLRNYCRSRVRRSTRSMSNSALPGRSLCSPLRRDCARTNGRRSNAATSIRPDAPSPCSDECQTASSRRTRRRDVPGAASH